MSEIKYSVGDNVQLRSGGPVMVVSKVYPGSGESDWVECIWFTGPHYDKIELDIRVLTKV